MTELWDLLVGPFVEFGFMRRALAGCLALSLGAAPVGVFLLLRRMSLTGDAMAHAILPGAAISYMIAGLSLPAMTAGGIISGLLVAMASTLVARSGRQSEDSSLAAFYLMSLSLGVVIVSTYGNQVDLLHVLFGSVLALDDDTLLLIGVISSITLLGLAVLYRPLVLECVDANLLPRRRAWGSVAHFGFMGLLVINLVAGFHALGTLMSIGLMVLPAAAARFWARTVNAMLVLSALLALVAGVAGLLLSYYFEWPTGPTIVLTLGLLYCVSLLLAPAGLLRRKNRPRRHETPEERLPARHPGRAAKPCCAVAVAAAGIEGACPPPCPAPCPAPRDGAAGGCPAGRQCGHRHGPAAGQTLHGRGLERLARAAVGGDQLQRAGRPGAAGGGQPRGRGHAGRAGR